LADTSARLKAIEDRQIELKAELDSMPDRVVAALQSAQGAGAGGIALPPPTTAAEAPSPLAEKILALTQKLTEMNQRMDDAGSNSITSSSTVAIVGETLFEHPGKSFAYAVPSTFSMPKVNVIDAWRMWHSGSKRCGESGSEKVRPFKNIPEEHLHVISKKVMRSWRIWKRVMDHLCDKLDDLKARGIYDWKGSNGNMSPLTPATIMYLARVIPAAPQKPGKSKRTVVASMNTVGTVSKNMSKANKA
jgi:hypothetical protein